MSDKKQHSEFAFPIHPNVMTVDNAGMTMRDYFAAKAMNIIPAPKDYVGEEETIRSYARFAEIAYKISDAMLKEREK